MFINKICLFQKIHNAIFCQRSAAHTISIHRHFFSPFRVKCWAHYAMGQAHTSSQTAASILGSGGMICWKDALQQSLTAAKFILESSGRDVHTGESLQLCF